MLTSVVRSLCVVSCVMAALLLIARCVLAAVSVRPRSGFAIPALSYCSRRTWGLRHTPCPSNAHAVPSRDGSSILLAIERWLKYPAGRPALFL